MKQTAFLLVATALLVASCGNRSTQNRVEGTEAQAAAHTSTETSVAIDTSASALHWKGFKPMGSHHGTLKIKAGTLLVADSQPVGGTFILDMNSIDCEDLTPTTGKEQLENHLKSEDFFEVTTYPEATFTITSITPLTEGEQTHRISGNLLLKGVEKNISFEARISHIDGVYRASTPVFTIDRTQWNVTYKSKSLFSDLKDSFINDEMEISLDICSSTPTTSAAN